MKKNVIVAPVGGNIDALYVGIREFPTERVILIATKDREEEAEKTKKDLDKFKIPAQIKYIDGNIWEEMFRVVGEIARLEKDKNVIINVSTGDKISGCAAVSAAFVNGLQAIDIDGNDAMMLPVLKFSYYRILTDKKMEILKIIHNDTECCASLDELSKKTGMSLPLISYHVNGNLKSDGLKSLGLVETTENRGRTAITLTTLGRLLVKGYV